MLAKAAATASVPSIKGTTHLDNHDVKIIQYKAALYKLVEMSRLLSVLAKNLEKPTGKNIIPLVNYILILFEGPLFNVHPIMRKRFQLLCSFKVCKIVPINPVLNTADIELVTQLPSVITDINSLREYMYKNELQWKLLGCLRSLVNNSSSIYERKLRQIQIERNAKRPVDSLGRPMPFDISTIEDILRPKESALCLDLAVLINNKEEDTSVGSMHKLQTQVLSKFVVCFKSKILPVLKTYYLQLKRFNSCKAMPPSAVKDLQHWEYSHHRIYALLLRSLYISEMIASILRQVYNPNTSYFNEVKTKLLSENVFAYEEVLQKMETICSSLGNQGGPQELIKTLQRYSKQGVLYQVQANNIIEVYQECICKVVPNIIDNLDTLETFSTLWKFIETNTDGMKSFSDQTQEQLCKMLDERMAVDKLTHIEKIGTGNEPPPSHSGSGTPSRGSIKRVVLGKTSISSTISSGTGSPGTISPLMNRSNSAEKTPAKFSIYGSPQVSRRGSISENRVSNYTNIPSKSVIDQKVPLKSPLSNTKSVGRPRSSSLQSPMEDKRNTRPPSTYQSRSNSLQADAAINQKIIQNTVNYLTTNGKIGTSTERTGVKLSGHLRTSKAQPKHISKRRSENDEDTNILAEVVSLTISEDENHQESSVEHSNNTGREELSAKSLEELACLKRVRFVGVPPMTSEEKKSPTKKGWYKKPAILHYPPPPPAFASQKYRLRQEGIAFKTSLRESGGDSKKTSLMMNIEVSPPKESTTQRITSKLRDKLR